MSQQQKRLNVSPAEKAFFLSLKSLTKSLLCSFMASSIFSMFSSVSLLLLGALISPGSKSGNMAMAIEDEDSMALLPFGSASGTGSFIRLPQCGGPRQTAPNSMNELVVVHNAARAQVNVKPIQWDEKVANFSQQYANQRINDCQLIHSNGPYGENIAWGSPDLTGIGVVKLWLDEKQFYYHDTNSCATSKVCGHYTQAVWRNSVRIGCARVKCNMSGGTIIICNYDPPGNYVGQRPY